MKKFKNKISDFFKWVSGSELVELDSIDVSEDPVRPELDLKFRLSYGRKIYGLEYKNNIEGVVCIAMCSEVPKSTRALEKFSSDEKEKYIAIAYTIWSRKRGAGRQLLGKIRKHVEKNTNAKRFLTLSPLTPVATHFHIKNGAKLVNINANTQNFEYELNKKDKDE